MYQARNYANTPADGIQHCHWESQWSSLHLNSMAPSQSFSHQLFLTQTHGDKDIRKRSKLQFQVYRNSRHCPSILPAPISVDPNVSFYLGRREQNTQLCFNLPLCWKNLRWQYWVSRKRRANVENLSSVLYSTVCRCLLHLSVLRRSWSNVISNLTAKLRINIDLQKQTFFTGYLPGIRLEETLTPFTSLLLDSRCLPEANRQKVKPFTWYF